MNDMSTAVARQIANIDREYKATEFSAMREFLIQEALRECDERPSPIVPRALGGR